MRARLGNVFAIVGSLTLTAGTALGLNIATATQSSAQLSGWLNIDGNIQNQSSTTPPWDWSPSGTATVGSNGSITMSGDNGLFNGGSPGSTSTAVPNPPNYVGPPIGSQGVISEAFIVDPISTSTTSCGTGDFTAFTSSAKNDDALSSYTWGKPTSPVLAKDDLTNTYAISRRDTSTHDLEVYFGAERMSNNGDSHADFEFFHDNVGLSGTCSGTFTGNREQGDFLVATDFTGGGTNALQGFYVWECSGTTTATVPAGTICNPGGTTYPNASYVLVTPPSSTDVSAASNTGSVPCGGWVCPEATGPAPGSVAADLFVEGAVDLTALSADAAIGFSGCATTFLPHTRTSQSFSAELKDFAGPVSFDTCSSKTTSTPSVGTGGSIQIGGSLTDSATVTGNGSTILPTGTVQFYTCGPGATSCDSTTGTALGSAVNLSTGTDNTTDNSVTVTSPQFTPTAAGTYCFAAVYSGDSNYPSSSDGSSDECFNVTQAPSSTGTTASHTGASLVIGSTGTFSDLATVTGVSGGGQPQGSVSFYLCGPTTSASTCDPNGTTQPITPSSASLVGTGSDTSTATLATSFTPTATGWYCFSAVYAPTSGNYTGSSDNTPEGFTPPPGGSSGTLDSAECQDVTQAGSSTGTTASHTGGSLVIGSTGTLGDVATVTGVPGGGAPAGTVDFYLCGPTGSASTCNPNGTTQPITPSSASLTSTGSDTSQATLSTSFTPTTVGWYCFAAVYAPTSGNYTGSSDNTPSGFMPPPGGSSGTLDSAECLDVTPAASSTGTTASHTGGSLVIGSTGTFSDLATVTGVPGGGQPQGTVDFYLCGPTGSASTCNPNGTTQPITPSSAPLLGTGSDTSTATLATSFTPTTVGWYCFAAVYAPTSGNYTGSSDNTPSGFMPPPGGSSGTLDSAECLDVTPAGSSTGTTASHTGANLVIGSTGTFGDVATVTGVPGGGAPAGSVNFYLCGPTSSASTCNPNGTTQPITPSSASLTATGSDTSQATLSTSFTPTTVGWYCFAAVYAPTSGNYTGSSDNTPSGFMPPPGGSSGTLDSAECLDVTPAASSTGTTASHTGGSLVLGQTGTFGDVATVTGVPGGGAPAGTVDFYLCGPTSSASTCNPNGTTQPITPSSASLTSTGSDTSQATLSTSFTPTATGWYCFAAVYAPTSGNYTGSSDNTPSGFMPPPGGSSGTLDSAECQDVTEAASSTGTTASHTGASLVIGSTGTLGDVATVTGVSGAGAPAGTVDFYLCGPTSSASTCNPNGTTQPITPSSASLTATGSITSQATLSTSFTPTTVGWYCFAAVYAPTSGNYSGSSDNTPAGFMPPPNGSSGTLDAAECLDVTPAGSSTGTTASHTGANLVIGSTGTFGDVATVTGVPGGGAPAGTVDFYLCGPTSSASTCDPNGTTQPITPSSASLTSTSSDTSQATLSTSFTPTTVGWYCFAAVYAPTSGNYTGSSDNTPEGFTPPPGGSSGTLDSAECLDVTPAGSSTGTTASHTGANLVIGSTGTFGDVATVTGVPGGGAPAGTVDFYLCGPTSSASTCDPNGTTQPITPSSASLTSTGSDTSQATLSTSFTPTTVGWYCFAAVYAPTSGNYTGSSDNTPEGFTPPPGGSSGTLDSAECLDVTPAASSTGTTASHTGDSLVIGSTGTFGDVATVTGVPGGGAPAGTVDFYLCGPTSSASTCDPNGTTQPITPSSASLTSTGSDTSQATLSTSFTPTTVGWYCFAAVYAPTSGNYAGSSDNTPEGFTPPPGGSSGTLDSAECLDVTQAPSSTGTTASHTGGSLTLGDTGTLGDVATVTGVPGGGAPAGTVDFYLCGPTSSANTCDPNGTTQEITPSSADLTATGSDTSQATLSTNFTPTATGWYCFAAVYAPDGGNYTGSSDNTPEGFTPPPGGSSGTLDSAECLDVTQPNFSVLKTDVPGDGNPVAPGSTIPYTVTVSNIGDGFGSATITDNLPSNVTLLTSPAPACGSFSGTGTGSDTCSVNASGNSLTIDVALSPGNSVPITFSATVSPTTTTDVVNTATITSGVCIGEATCSSTVTNPVPNFTVLKTDVPGDGNSVTPGSTIPYTVKITNVGDGAGSATIADNLPSNLTLLTTPAPACGTVSGTNTSSDTCSVSASGNSLTINVTLGPGNSVSVTFSATVSPTTTTAVVNIATIVTGPCNTSAGCSSTVTNPVLVTTTVTPPPPPAPTTPVPAATTVHTGEPWAGSRLIELILLGLGVLFVGVGELRRRRLGHAGYKAH